MSSFHITFDALSFQSMKKTQNLISNVVKKKKKERKNIPGRVQSQTKRLDIHSEFLSSGRALHFQFNSKKKRGRKTNKQINESKGL